MTLQEKFIEASELYFPIDTNCNYEEKLLVDIKYRREYFIEGCEYQLKEQEDFAIGFGEYLDSLTAQDMGILSIKELLEIYKKETL